MKKILLLLLGTFLLTAVSTASALQARGWRITVTDSIANDTDVVIAEVEWLYYASYDISTVTTGKGGTFSFSNKRVGDVTDQFPTAATFTVEDSTGNDGTYTVASSSFNSNTNITTVTVASSETISDNTADGTITTDDLVDGSRPDFGKSSCGWTRKVPNLTGDVTPISVGCDNVSVNFRPHEDLTIPSGTPRTRLGKLMFDDSVSTFFRTRDKVTESSPFYIQYVWYTGRGAPGRTLPDIEAYSITIPTAYLGPGEDGLAPSNWTIEYLDPNSGLWVTDTEVNAANFNDGTTVTGGKKLQYNLP